MLWDSDSVVPSILASKVVIVVDVCIITVLWRLVADSKATPNEQAYVFWADVDENGGVAAVKCEAYNVAVVLESFAGKGLIQVSAVLVRDCVCG